MGAEFEKWRAITTLVIKWVLKILLWAAFGAWLAVFFLYPLAPLQPFFVHLFNVLGETVYKLLGLLLSLLLTYYKHLSFKYVVV